MIKIQNTPKYHISQESAILLKDKKQINHAHMYLRAVIIATVVYVKSQRRTNSLTNGV